MTSTSLRAILAASAVSLTLVTPTWGTQASGGLGERLQRFEGDHRQTRLGWSVADAGDVDGDGYSDLLVGAPGARQAGGTDPIGSAFVYSGADGALLHRFDGATAYDWMGSAVAGDTDFDLDGVPDFVVTALGYGGAGAAFIYSGATGAQLHRLDSPPLGANSQFGSSVAIAGDADADGTPDIAVGAFLASSGTAQGVGGVVLYSGATGQVIRTHFGTGPLKYFGTSVAGVGDVDLDGHDDLLVGEPIADSVGSVAAGSAWLFSGATGQVLRRFDGSASLDYFGGLVASAGDLDGDGVPDVLVGAIGTEVAGMSDAGSVFLYSGATGGLIRRVDGVEENQGFGSGAAILPDVDGDGRVDLMSFVAGTVGAAVHVRSLEDGRQIETFGGEPGDSGFVSASPVSDVDGDGLTDLILGACYDNLPGRIEGGTVSVYSIDPLLHPSSDSISLSSGQAVQLQLAFPASEGGATFAVLASAAGTGPTTLAGLNIPLTVDPVFLATASSTPPSLLAGARGVLSPTGQATAALQPSPALAPLVGTTLYFCAVSFDSSPFLGRLASTARAIAVLP